MRVGKIVMNCYLGRGYLYWVLFVKIWGFYINVLSNPLPFSKKRGSNFRSSFFYIRLKYFILLVTVLQLQFRNDDPVVREADSSLEQFEQLVEVVQIEGLLFQQSKVLLLFV